MAAKKQSVLFVCLGNICRSPTAEAIFTKLVNDRGLADKWRIDSAGMIDMHAGNEPDDRALDLLRRKKVPVNHRARQVTSWDFTEFEYILGMDKNNMRDLQRMKPSNSTATLKLFGSYDPEGKTTIHDPYFGDDSGFEIVYDQCVRCCEAFLNDVSQ